MDLLFVLIDWYEGGDVQSAKKICALCGNSPQEMVLSTGRHFVFTQILIMVISIGLIFLPNPIIYYLPRAFPTRSADFNSLC